MSGGCRIFKGLREDCERNHYACILRFDIHVSYLVDEKMES